MYNFEELLRNTALDTPENHKKVQMYYADPYPYGNLHPLLHLLKTVGHLSSHLAQTYFDTLLQHQHIDHLTLLFEALQQRSLMCDTKIQERCIELIQLQYAEILRLLHIFGNRSPHALTRTPILLELMDKAKTSLTADALSTLLIQILAHIKITPDISYQYDTGFLTNLEQDIKNGTFASWRFILQCENLGKILTHQHPEDAYICIRELYLHQLSTEEHIDLLLAFEAPLLWLHAYIKLQQAGLHTEDNWTFVAATIQHKTRDAYIQTNMPIGSSNLNDIASHASSKYIAEFLVLLKGARLFDPAQFHQQVRRPTFEIQVLNQCLTYLNTNAILDQETLNSVLEHPNTQILWSVFKTMKSIDKEQFQLCVAHADLAGLVKTLRSVLSIEWGRNPPLPKDQLYSLLQKRILSHPNIIDIQNGINNLSSMSRHKGTSVFNAVLPMLLMDEPNEYINWLWDEIQEIEECSNSQGQSTQSEGSHHSELLPRPVPGAFFTEHDVLMSIHIGAVVLPLLSLFLIRLIQQKEYNPKEFPLKTILTPEAFDVFLSQLDMQNTADAHLLAGLLLQGKIPSQVMIKVNDNENDHQYQMVLYSDDPENPDFLIYRAYAEDNGAVQEAIKHYEKSILLLNKKKETPEIQKMLDLMDFFVWEIQTTTEDSSSQQYLKAYALSPGKSNTPPQYGKFFSPEQAQPKAFSEYLIQKEAEKALQDEPMQKRMTNA
ncbi:MAG: hypothetical protein CK424_05750 [Legionella sp.]|nr:MAG: hypothetical protein CK424_05750 [Legionella sp.]